MESLTKLEAQTVALLEKFDRVHDDNVNLRTTAAKLAAEKASLEAETDELRDRLARETKLRNEAVVRIDALLSKVDAALSKTQEHGGAE